MIIRTHKSSIFDYTFVQRDAFGVVRRFITCLYIFGNLCFNIRTGTETSGCGFAGCCDSGRFCQYFFRNVRVYAQRVNTQPFDTAGSFDVVNIIYKVSDDLAVLGVIIPEFAADTQRKYGILALKDRLTGGFNYGIAAAGSGYTAAVR